MSTWDDGSNESQHFKSDITNLNDHTQEGIHVHNVGTCIDQLYNVFP